jgi:hypothetical protein
VRSRASQRSEWASAAQPFSRIHSPWAMISRSGFQASALRSAARAARRFQNERRQSLGVLPSGPTTSQSHDPASPAVHGCRIKLLHPVGNDDGVRGAVKEDDLFHGEAAAEDHLVEVRSPGVGTAEHWCGQLTWCQVDWRQASTFRRIWSGCSRAATGVSLLGVEWK